MTDSNFVLVEEPVKITASANYTREDASVSGLSGGGYVVTWTQRNWGTGQPETDDVYFQLFNADGSENGSAVLVNTTVTDHQGLSDVAVLNDGTFVVTWTDFSGQDSDGDGIFMQRYDASGAVLGVETQINTSTAGDQSETSVVALSGGGYAVVWTDYVDTGGGNFTTNTLLQRYTSAGVAVGSETVIQSEVSTGNVSFSAPEIVELTGGNLAVSWTRYDTTGDAFAQFSIVSSAGVAVAGPIDPEQTSDDAFTLPQIHLVELGNGNVLSVWMYAHNVTGAVNVGYGEVYGRIYDASGVAVGSEFAIASGTDNRRFDLYAEADGNGGAMIGYVQEDDSVNERALLVQNISQTGVLTGDPVWVNHNQGGQSNSGDLGLLDNGDIIAAFQDSGGGALSNIFNIRIGDGEDARFSSTADTVVLLNTGETVAALEGDDTITGGTGDDVVGGGSGVDTVNGGDGNDTLDGGGGDDDLFGEGDNDYLFGRDGNDDLDGGIGDDFIDGGQGDDIINGGDNDDTLIGGYGADTINGGDGADTIYGYRGEYNDIGPNDVDRDLGITNTLNGGAGDDYIYGGEGDDIINGGDGADRAFGDNDLSSVGNDTFIASNGNDIYNGMGGSDTVDYSGMGGAITALLSRYPGTSNTSGEVLIAANGPNPQYDHTTYYIENIIGTVFADTITGDDAVNTLDGGSGDDTLNGGDGDDTIISGLGTDTVDGGNGTDTVDYTNSNNTQTINLVTNVNIGGFAHNDTLTSIENVVGSDTRGDDVTGTTGENTLVGMGADDKLRGHNGDDLLFGGEGNDYLYGGRGGDTLNGGNGYDWAMYLASDAAVTVDLASGGTGGYADGDTYLSIERVRGSAFDDTITGDSGINRLLGDDGADILNGLGDRDDLRGGAGNDTLNGGADNDTMRGDADNDTFVFEAASGHDFIVDFEDNIDTINIDDALYGGGLTATEVVDTYMTMQNPNRFFFDFGNGNVLHVLSATGLVLSDFYDDVTIV